MQSCKKINPVLTSFRLRLCLQEHSFGQSRTRKRWASGFSNPPHRDHSTSTKKFLTKKRIPARVGLYRWSLISSVLTDERGVVEHPLRFMTSKRCSWNFRQSCVCVWIKARSQTHQYRRKWGAFSVSVCLLVCELMCVWEYLPFIDHIRDKHVEADKVWLWGFVYMCACPDLSKQRWRSVRNLTLGCLLTLDVLKYHAFPSLLQLKKAVHTQIKLHLKNNKATSTF